MRGMGEELLFHTWTSAYLVQLWNPFIGSPKVDQLNFFRHLRYMNITYHSMRVLILIPAFFPLGRHGGPLSGKSSGWTRWATFFYMGIDVTAISQALSSAWSASIARWRAWNKGKGSRFAKFIAERREVLRKSTLHDEGERLPSDIIRSKL